MPAPTDDFAPAASKAKWFAAFYLCIPVGFALGYIFGGAVTAAASWRWTFVLEGAAMLPFIVFALTAQPLQLRGSKPAGGAGWGGRGVRGCVGRIMPFDARYAAAGAQARGRGRWCAGWCPGMQVRCAEHGTVGERVGNGNGGQRVTTGGQGRRARARA